MNQLIQTLNNTAEQAIETAYKDGYKQGVLEYSPQATALQAINSSLERENERLKTRQTIAVAAGFCGGLIIGTVIFSMAQKR